MSKISAALSPHIKTGAKIVAMALVIENPDGEQIMVRPDDIANFTIDVETTWQGMPFASPIAEQKGRLMMEFRVLGLMKTRPVEVRETDEVSPGVWLPGMTYEVIR